jgi:DNA-directed RNA polymerase specialized sigma24 family protein
VAAERFEDFFADEYLPAVRLARRLGPGERAEDVAAEAFERMYRHWDAVEQPVAYVRRTVRSIVTDDLRRAASRSGLPTSPLPRHRHRRRRRHQGRAVPRPADARSRVNAPRWCCATRWTSRSETSPSAWACPPEL